MKNYGPSGEVNARLDDLDTDVININTAIAQIQLELNAEKLWNVSSGIMTIQEDQNGAVTKVDLENRAITGVATDEDDDSSVANVSHTSKTAIKYSLIF